MAESSLITTYSLIQTLLSAFGLVTNVSVIGVVLGSRKMAMNLLVANLAFADALLLRPLRLCPPPRVGVLALRPVALPQLALRPDDLLCHRGVVGTFVVLAVER